MTGVFSFQEIVRHEWLEACQNFIIIMEFPCLNKDMCNSIAMTF